MKELFIVVLAFLFIVQAFAESTVSHDEHDTYIKGISSSPVAGKSGRLRASNWGVGSRFRNTGTIRRSTWRPRRRIVRQRWHNEVVNSDSV
jgi:hypothetical protein